MDLDALHEDLYRMGNATSPNFNEERLFIDCRVIHRNGIKVVLANGNGFSAFSYITGAMKRRGKNVWKIKKGSVLPQGVVVVKDLTNEAHYMLAPAVEMPFKSFWVSSKNSATTRASRRNCHHRRLCYDV